MPKITKEEALNYHSSGKPGKIEVVPTKPYSRQYDLSLAYTPGVAKPCLEIKENPEDVFTYTAKGNLVAVISNGTAVLGLGDIGPAAGKPVMEGKGLLFKVFADVDVFDLEVDEKDIDKFCFIARSMAPTFGGINLEDIKAPECFEIENRLKKEMDVPVFHDDQHGTAIISGAGLLNALEINGKKIEDLKMVVCGAGAGAISCTRLYVSLGIKKENIVMLDSKGVLNKKRKDLNKYKMEFATDRDIETLEEAVQGADLFLGLSVANQLSKEMVQSMADDPIVFAMANPDPEITYEDAIEARKDIIFATGRSDYPNQINNVLGFPFIFRGALDVRATDINEEMKIAACHALAGLAKEMVPEEVNQAYNETNLKFGREYIIPKPLDPRLIVWVASAVAKAAMDSGVARKPISDWDAYKKGLIKRMGLENKLLQNIREKAKRKPKKVVFAEASKFNILKAAQIAVHEGFAEPVLLGNEGHIKSIIEENKLELPEVKIIDPAGCAVEDKKKEFARLFFEKRQRKGITYNEAYELMNNRNYYGMMMVETGEADAFISGMTSKYSDTIRPALQIVGSEERHGHIAGMYVLMTKRGPLFFADTTVNVKPSAETLVSTTLLAAETVKKFNIEPRIAMVAYSNFGSYRGEGSPNRVREAIGILHKEHPELLVDGEMQANYALDGEIRNKRFPFSKLQDKEVNTIIFPNLSAGNIAYKLMQGLGTEAIGPILMGIRKPVHILQQDSSIREIVDMAAIAVIDAQSK